MHSKVLTLKKLLHGGVLPALATPLMPDGETLKESVLERLVDFLLSSSVKGLFVGGTTGEGILLNFETRKMLHQQVTAIASGQVPLLLHVGANNTAESAALAQHAATLNADGIIAVTPFYYPLHDDALLAHYQAIAAAAPSTPLFVYDIPHMAINGISPALVSRLADSLPTFAGVKCSNQDAQKIRQLIDAAAGEYMILVGNERIALGSLALGADGLISGLSTAVPEPFVSLVDAFFQGDYTEALRQQKLINRILDLIPAGARIGAVKSLLVERGIDVGPPVPPRPRPPDGWQAWPKIASMINTNPTP